MTEALVPIRNTAFDCLSGSFEPTPQAARLSASPVFDAGRRPATVRFTAPWYGSILGEPAMVARIRQPGSASLVVQSEMIPQAAPHADDLTGSDSAVLEFDDAARIRHRLGTRFRSTREIRLEDEYGRVRWTWLEWHPFLRRVPTLPARFLLCAWFPRDQKPEDPSAAHDAGTRVALGTLTLGRTADNCDGGQPSYAALHSALGA